MPKPNSSLFTFESLLAVGMTLIMIGVFLRGFAASANRDIALRRQHWLHRRKLGEADPTDRQSGWLARNLGTISLVALLTGLLATGAAFLR